MPITVSIDEERQTARYLFRGAVTGQEFVAFMVQALRSAPALADCDAICDLSDYTGDVTTDYMASVAMLMNELRASERPVRTALVSCDDGFTSWAQVMNHQFVGRRFQVFGSVRAAEAWLQACRQGRDAA